MTEVQRRCIFDGEKEQETIVLFLINYYRCSFSWVSKKKNQRTEEKTRRKRNLRHLIGIDIDKEWTSDKLVKIDCCDTKLYQTFSDEEQ